MLAARGPHTQDVTVVIPKGANAKQIGELLENKGVIHSAKLFYYTAKATFLAPTLKAGEYRIQAQISTRDILNRLALGKTQNRSITFPEGWTVAQTLKRLEANEGFVGEAVATQEKITEGLLYPDTYSFTFGEKRSKIITKMQNRAKEELAKAWANRSENTPLTTPEELLVLASIIEKETNLTTEMAKVAGVYVNRLNQGILLQADPTVIYGLIQAGKYNGNLKRSHLKDATNRYNTYMHKGLPPTPIANPSAAAMNAAANPEVHDYLFFVATGTGGHNFAKTYTQHKRNVAKYLIEYRAQNKKK